MICENCGRDVALYEYCADCWRAWFIEGDSVFDKGCPVTYARFSDHVAGCEICLEQLLAGGSYCMTGESLNEIWLDTLEMGDEDSAL